MFAGAQGQVVAELLAAGKTDQSRPEQSRAECGRLRSLEERSQPQCVAILRAVCLVSAYISISMSALWMWVCLCVLYVRVCCSCSLVLNSSVFAIWSIYAEKWSEHLCSCCCLDSINLRHFIFLPFNSWIVFDMASTLHASRYFTIELHICEWI